MDGWFSSVLDALKKLGLVLYAAVAVSCGVFVFTPAEKLKSIGLGQVPEEYRWILGVIFVFSSALAVFYSVARILKAEWAQEGVASVVGRFASFGVKRGFDRLSIHEQGLIRVIVNSHNNYFQFNPDDQTLQSLIDKGWVEHPHGMSRNTFKVTWVKWEGLNQVGVRAQVREADILNRDGVDGLKLVETWIEYNDRREV